MSCKQPRISFVFYGVPLTVAMVPMLAFEDHQGRGNGYLLVGMERPGCSIGQGCLQGFGVGFFKI